MRSIGKKGELVTLQQSNELEFSQQDLKETKLQPSDLSPSRYGQNQNIFETPKFQEDPNSYPRKNQKMNTHKDVINKITNTSNHMDKSYNRVTCTNPAANEIQAPLDEVTLAQASRPQTQQEHID